MHSIKDKHIIYKKFLKYQNHGNASLNGYPKQLANKSFTKEDAQDISLVLPSFLVDFAPHTWLILLDMMVIENKKAHVCGPPL
jgi:hypothetical protein